MIFSGSPLPAAPQTSAQPRFPRRPQPATRPETPPVPAKTAHPPPRHIPPAPRTARRLLRSRCCAYYPTPPFVIYLYFSELFAKNQYQIIASAIILPES